MDHCRVSSMWLARSKFRQLHYIMLPLGYLLLEKGRMEFLEAPINKDDPL